MKIKLEKWNMIKFNTAYVLLQTPLPSYIQPGSNLEGPPFLHSFNVNGTYVVSQTNLPWNKELSAKQDIITT
jgi:hypothetical protein